MPLPFPGADKQADSSHGTVWCVLWVLWRTEGPLAKSGDQGANGSGNFSTEVTAKLKDGWSLSHAFSAFAFRTLCAQISASPSACSFWPFAGYFHFSSGPGVDLGIPVHSHQPFCSYSSLVLLLGSSGSSWLQLYSPHSYLQPLSWVPWMAGIQKLAHQMTILILKTWSSFSSSWHLGKWSSW